MYPTTIRKITSARNEALLSLDKDKIVKWSLDNGITVPDNDEAFWAGVHKAILLLSNVSNDKRIFSINWLTSRGYELPLGAIE